jgi:feruloyl-CoA synthase
LAQALFANLRIMQYGGAALTQDVYRRLQQVAARQTGEEIT